jgi:hypothetical protein
LQILLFSGVLYLPLIAFMVLMCHGKELRRSWHRRNQPKRKEADMTAVQGTTWDIEVGISPNPDRYNGFDKTERFHLFADTHDKAAVILRKYRPDLNLDHIVKSERSGLTVIVDFPN